MQAPLRSRLSKAPRRKFRSRKKPPRASRRADAVRRASVALAAAKAHPELHGGGGVLLTYVANSLDFGTLVNDEALYYPRFLHLRLP